MKFKTVAIYYRVSTNKQDFDSQKYAIDNWLSQNHVGKVIEFEDFAQSGAKADRKQYQKMLKLVAKRKIDAIVAYKLDRLSRSIHEAIGLFLKIQMLGIDLVCVNQPVFTTPGNPFKWTMLMAFAELAQLERDILITRIRDGIQAARRKGVRFGPAPKLTPEKILEIKKLREEKLTLREIAKKVRLSMGSVHRAINIKSLEE